MKGDALDTLLGFCCCFCLKCDGVFGFAGLGSKANILGYTLRELPLLLFLRHHVLLGPAYYMFLLTASTLGLAGRPL